MLPGGSFFSQADSFSMTRGKHVDIAVLTLDDTTSQAMRPQPLTEELTLVFDDAGAAKPRSVSQRAMEMNGRGSSCGGGASIRIALRPGACTRK